MTDSPYARVGARLIERGYCAVPAMPGKKVPGALVAGRWQYMEGWAKRYLDRLPSEREIDSWSAPPDGGVCIILGRASQHIVAVDIDVDEVTEAVTRALPYTPFRKRGEKGETLFFRGTCDLKAFNRRRPDGSRERMVDLLAEGRQTVIPPSIHPETRQPYMWTGERALEDANFDEVPELPGNVIDLIAAALEPFGYREQEEAQHVKSRQVYDENEKSAHRLLNEAALANLELWVPALGLFRARRLPKGYEAVADWRASCTGRPLDKRKLNLSITPAGITDFGDGPKGYTPIDLVIASGRAPDVERAFVWLSERTGWGSPVFHNPKPRARKTIVEQGAVADAETGEVLEQERPVPREEKPWRRTAPIAATAVDVTQCPGLVGKIADWIVASSDFQQPLLAIGAALTIVGTVAGRQLGGPTKSGTHLYVIGVAPTGAGKDHPLKSVTQILIASKLRHLVGPDNLTSERSFLNCVIRSPASVCPMDEFGSFLASSKNRTASTHEKLKSAILRKLWGSSFRAMSTTERAGEKSELIYSPALSIYGTSTIGELYDALSEQDTHNGLLNRFLILESPNRPERVKPCLDRFFVPAEIADGINAIYWRLGEMGAAPYHGEGDKDAGAQPALFLPWRDAAAEAEFDALQRKLIGMMDADPEQEKFLVRTAEMAVRIATIRAVGIDAHDPRVTVDDMRWGEALAMHSANAMIEGARDRIAENDRQKWFNRVIEVMRKRELTKPRDIQLSLRGALRASEIKDIIFDLIESGRVEVVNTTDERSDTKRLISYKFIK